MKKLIHSEILVERLSIEEATTIERHPVSVLLSNIRSLYNVGSMFRTCDAALVQELILCGYTPHPPREEIEKTALGAVDTVPWKYHKKEENAILELKEKGIKVIALEITDKKKNYDELIYQDFPLCIVLGNEISGIDNNVLDLCDNAIEIPMYGVKHSLNVSVAGGIAIFEAVRIWKKLKIKN